MILFVVPSLVSLLIQAVGALLFGTLCLILQNTVHRDPLRYWSIGWFALGAGLISLLISFNLQSVRLWAETLYILFEYVFAYLLIVGCRCYVTGARPARSEAWLLVPALLVATFLPRISGGDFDVFFAAHTLIYAYLFLIALRVFWRVKPNRGSLAGVRVLRIALLLLTIDYAHYSPLYAASSYGWLPPVLPYLVYSSLYDLLFLVLLAFGMVLMTTGDVHHELEVANKHLGRVRDRLEAMAQLDHLTSALNRHAFYSIIGDSPEGRPVTFSGCAAMADIDSLKRFNDQYGHVAGDVAIRLVTNAIRARIRADDLLFRWGGDEFLVLLLGVSEDAARARLDSVNQSLQQVTIAGVPTPVDISVTVGYAPFDSAASLDSVIAVADTAMYGRKRILTESPVPLGRIVTH